MQWPLQGPNQLRNVETAAVLSSAVFGGGGRLTHSCLVGNARSPSGEGLARDTAQVPIGHLWRSTPSTRVTVLVTSGKI